MTFHHQSVEHVVLYTSIIKGLVAKLVTSTSSASSSSSVGPMANATDVLQPIGLLYSPYPPRLFGCSHIRHQVHDDARDPSSERWNYVGEN